QYLAEPDGWSRALWAQYAELGLLGLPFAEEYGGFGGGGVEIMLVMEAVGRTLVVEPYLATIVLGGTAVQLAASPAQPQAAPPSSCSPVSRLAPTRSWARSAAPSRSSRGSSRPGSPPPPPRRSARWRRCRR